MQFYHHETADGSSFSAAGYKAIFVSVDLPIIGSRLNEARNNFPHPLEATLPNLNFPDGRHVPEEAYAYGMCEFASIYTAFCLRCFTYSGQIRQSTGTKQ